MEPIDAIRNVQKERWELQCCLCRQRMGAKIQCGSCFNVRAARGRAAAARALPHGHPWGAALPSPKLGPGR